MPNGIETTRTSKLLSRLSLACLWRSRLVFLLATLMCSNALAQFKLDIQKVADSAFPSDVSDEQDEQPARNNRLAANFGFGDIDRFIFNQFGSKSDAKKAVAKQLTVALQTITKDCSLNEEQQAKLRLAGEVDMARTFAEFEKIRSEFDFKNRNDINKLMQLVSPLQQKLQSGLFGPKSLFRRTSKTLLDPTQIELLEKKERERLRFYFGAHMKQTIAKIEKQAPLRRSQRDQLLDLVDDLDAPLKMDRQYMRYFTMYSLSKLESQLDTLLTKKQFAAIKPSIQQGRRYERTLKQRGLIE